MTTSVTKFSSIEVTSCYIPEAGSFDVLRLDLLHPVTGGNKVFKLKYNLEAAKLGGYRSILTFGGSSSNHLAAAALACSKEGLQLIAIVRGEPKNSNTLKFIGQQGAEICFVSRQEYKMMSRNNSNVQERFGDVYVIPEGGANAEGVRGCSEILGYVKQEYDYIFCAVGTGTTYAGLQMSKPPGSVLIGINVAKGGNSMSRPFSGSAWEVRTLADIKERLSSDCILSSYTFGGYACYEEGVIDFQRGFEKRTGITLDHIYTSKLFYAASDLRRRGMIAEHSRVLIVHSGGVQGNADFRERYKLSW